MIQAWLMPWTFNYSCVTVWFLARPAAWRSLIPIDHLAQIFDICLWTSDSSCDLLYVKKKSGPKSDELKNIWTSTCILIYLLNKTYKKFETSPVKRDWSHTIYIYILINADFCTLTCTLNKQQSASFTWLIVGGCGILSHTANELCWELIAEINP